jgi:hypothetical protein
MKDLKGISNPAWEAAYSRSDPTISGRENNVFFLPTAQQQLPVWRKAV